MNSSYVPNKSEFERKWHIVDAEGVILGKLAAKVAQVLQGKSKPTYTPFIDTGDFVIVTNADKVKLTGKKATDKVYMHYTGYSGGQKLRTAADLFENHPTQVVELAVKRMMPKTVLGKSMFKKLKVYAADANYEGEKHPHCAQKPEVLNVS